MAGLETPLSAIPVRMPWEYSPGWDGSCAHCLELFWLPA